MRITTTVVILIGAGWLAGCGSQSAREVAPTETRPPATESAAPPAMTPAEPAPEPLDCGPAIPGAEPLLVPGAVVMLGELHGTAEIPAFVGQLVCRAAAAGHPVRLGVEIKAGEQAAIDAYLASDGGAAARQALLASPHWNMDVQDGRASEAMLGLIETARDLRARGHAVDVFAFDADTHTDWNDRDAQMARGILARATPDAVVLTLTGNLHNRTTPGLRWDANAIPMGVHVKEARAQAVSLQPGFTGGSAWNCRPDGCGEIEVGGRPEYAQRQIALSADKAGQDGLFSVGAITASPPAIGVPAP